MYYTAPADWANFGGIRSLKVCGVYYRCVPHGLLLAKSYLSVEMQSVYTTVPADKAEIHDQCC